MLTGKTPNYTGVYNNNEYNCETFRGNFSSETFIKTLPEYLKDSAGYFTYCINKVFHCPTSDGDFDFTTTDPCSKALSWNKILNNANNNGIAEAANENIQGVEHFKWAAVDSSLTTAMQDYIATDSAIAFFNAYAENPAAFCDKPFFLAMGYHKPHSNLYIPEQYFFDDYVLDFYTEPFDIPYNYPLHTYPYNGVVMSPQPEVPYADFDALGYAGKYIAAEFRHKDFIEWAESLETLPTIDQSITDAERIEILIQAKRANALMAYIAAIQFVDDQLGRFMESLASHPELYNNTIILFTSDHGYMLDEKKHYEKQTLWEAAIRVPFIYIDMRNPKQQVCNRTVNLLDIFPTILDAADIDFPVFPDGKTYLDGKSFLPLVENPSVPWEKPELTILQHEDSLDLSCFEQYSVRNETFHFIRYQTDGTSEQPGCDYDSAVFEYEFYEIGANRELDPDEWNNLADDVRYHPVMDYMESFLPGKENYLEKMYAAQISLINAPCIYKMNDILQMQVAIFDEQGIQITGDALNNLTMQWKNNRNEEIYEGVQVSIPLNEIYIDNTTDQLFFYLDVYDNNTGERKAFQVKKIAVNTNNEPQVSYCVHTKGLQATIDNYRLTGAIHTSVWDFGEGVTFSGIIPASYTYDAAGSYIINNTVTYGNACSKSFPYMVAVDTLLSTYTDMVYSIYPVPAQNSISFNYLADSELESIEIYNMLGQKFEDITYNCVHGLVTVDVQKLHPGSYILKAGFIGKDITSPFSIIR